MKTFQTSHCLPNNMIIESDGQGLVFSRFPRARSFDEILVVLKDSRQMEKERKQICRNGDRHFRMRDIADGDYSLDIFFSQRDGIWMGYIYGHDVKIRVRHGVPSFIKPWCMESNVSVIRRFSTSRETMHRLLCSNSQYPCNDPLVREIALSLSSGLNDDYGKLLAVHDWVAEKIYYDIDALRQNSLRRRRYSSTLEALRQRRAVCQGYSDIAASLLRAMGIPACSVGCFALGETSSGGWERWGNRIGLPNHAFTLAYVYRRYVFMDVTWDSDNVYSGGQYGHKTGAGKTRKYFDASVALLSATHRLVG